MKRDRFIAIRNQAESNTLELYFLDVIADTYDWYSGANSKVQEIIDKVNYYKPSKILCIIDSVGGDAQLGMSIYNFLKLCSAKVSVDIIGLAGSIASVVAMAADQGELRIASSAFMMIHKAEGGMYGSADDLRKGADLVDMYTNQIVEIYSLRTGKTVAEINKLIENGDYWMTGEQCVGQGFADVTFNGGVENLEIAARLDTSIYKNIPAQIRAQIKNELPAAEDHKTFFTKQFDDMKKWFLDIVNAIRQVKPVEGTAITNQIADAVTTPFEKLADEIDSNITNKVNETIASKPVNDAIALQVANAVKVIDFKQGDAKTALDSAVSLGIANALKFDQDGPVKTAFDTAVTNAVTARTKDLETELTNLKGKQSVSGKEDKPKQPIGTWVEG